MIELGNKNREIRDLEDQIFDLKYDIKRSEDNAESFRQQKGAWINRYNDLVKLLMQQGILSEDEYLFDSGVSEPGIDYHKLSVDVELALQETRTQGARERLGMYFK